jgi:hypothetical protein
MDRIRSVLGADRLMGDAALDTKARARYDATITTQANRVLS